MLAAHILIPLKVTHGHAAGIRKHVRHNRNPSRKQNIIRFWRRRAVRQLKHHLCCNQRSVAFRDDILECGWDQNTTRQQEQLLIRDIFCSFKMRNGTCFFLVFNNSWDTQPKRIVNPSACVRNADDAETMTMAQRCKMLSCISKSLNDYGGTFWIQKQFLTQRCEHVQPALRRGRPATFAAACGDRLSCHHRRMPIFVRDPIHFPRRGIHVWRWYINLWPDDAFHPLCPSTRESLHFTI